MTRKIAHTALYPKNVPKRPNFRDFGQFRFHESKNLTIRQRGGSFCRVGSGTPLPDSISDPFLEAFTSEAANFRGRKTAPSNQVWWVDVQRFWSIWADFGLSDFGEQFFDLFTIFFISCFYHMARCMSKTIFPIHLCGAQSYFIAYITLGSRLHKTTIITDFR